MRRNCSQGERSLRRWAAHNHCGPRPERTLLLVDDEDNILSSLRRLLRRDGYTILTANGGKAGLEEIGRAHV